MISFDQFKLLFILGAIVFGGVVGAIVSATGYAALMAHARSGVPPFVYGLLACAGGAMLSLRISHDRPWSTRIKTAFAVACALLLGTIAYIAQAEQLAVKAAALPTIAYASLSAIILGVVSTIACMCVKD
jgi:hypothetical protein